VGVDNMDLLYRLFGYKKCTKCGRWVSKEFYSEEGLCYWCSLMKEIKARATAKAAQLLMEKEVPLGYLAIIPLLMPELFLYMAMRSNE
jgi:hypothetical protein